MSKIGNTFFHITRYTYKKIKQDIFKHSLEPLFDLNRMIWGEEIYLNNKSNLIEVKKFNNGVLYELLYHGYRLFFIREYQEVPYRNNVFWVNILNEGTVYNNYKNESIMTYKFDEFENGKQIVINGEKYTAVHTGNSFNRYCNLQKINDNNIESQIRYWEDFRKSLDGLNSQFEFVTSTFANNIIVYGVKLRT